MNLAQKNIFIVVFLSGILFLALGAHAASPANIAPKAPAAPVLAPAEEPITSMASNQSADISVAYNKFVFPNTLSSGNLPLTAEAMLVSVVTAGTNPILLALAGLLIIVGYAHHRKAVAIQKKN